MRSYEFTTEPIEAHAPVDLVMLSRLLGTDDKSYLLELLSIYWGTMEKTPAELRRLFDARDAGSLRDAAHAAKGASASVGAVPASNLLKALQFAAAESAWDQIAEIMPKLEMAFGELERYIVTLNLPARN